MPLDALGRAGRVLLLGGSSEIGRAIAARISRPGAEVVLAGRGAEGTAFDATDVSGHDAWVESVFADHGDFDVVIVAFGVLGDQQRAEADGAHALEVVDVNYRGAVSVMLPIAAQLRRQGHGTLVVLSSVAGERVRRANFVYGSTKAGLDAFAQGLHASLEGSGARVLIVRPGFVHTKMTDGLEPAPMAIGPDEVAEAVAHGLRRGARVVWAPGKLRWVMAVIRHLPWFVFRRIAR